jgi:GTP-binding protein
MLATTLEADPYLGRTLTGRISAGSVRPNQPIKAIGRDGAPIETARVTKVLGFRGLERTALDVAEAGDIVAIAGLTHASVADTLCDMGVETPLPAQPIDPPTLAMIFRINDGPFAGQEGSKVQSRVIRDRLLRERERNIAIRVSEQPDSDSFEVAGRGELQLGILIETMRREGFELTVSRPRVVMQRDPVSGQRLEPIEEVIIDVDEGHSGSVVRKLAERRADLQDMRPSGGGRRRLVFHVPTRGLIGYHGELLTDTRGTAVMNRIFHGYAPFKGEIAGRRTGVLVANATGEATAYALYSLQDRGAMLISPQTRVYEGMIVGEHTRDNDLIVNVIQGKKLTNIRAAGKDDALILTPPLRLTLEQALSYIADDELVEVTPKSLRLRKRWLAPNERKKRERARAAEEAV